MSPQNSQSGSEFFPTLSVTVFGEGFKNLILVKGSHRVGSNPIELVSLIQRERNSRELFPPERVCREKAMWAHSEKVAVYLLGSKTSLETSPDGTWS